MNSHRMCFLEKSTNNNFSLSIHGPAKLSPAFSATPSFFPLADQLASQPPIYPSVHRRRSFMTAINNGIINIDRLHHKRETFPVFCYFLFVSASSVVLFYHHRRRLSFVTNCTHSTENNHLNSGGIRGRDWLMTRTRLNYGDLSRIHNPRETLNICTFRSVVMNENKSRMRDRKLGWAGPRLTRWAIV